MDHKVVDLWTRGIETGQEATVVTDVGHGETLSFVEGSGGRQIGWKTDSR